jgi:tetratricopeptide (TPR) repeat protein
VTGYGTREVASMLGLSAGQVRSWVRSGFLNPDRDMRGRLRFSFEDLVLLRAAQGLLAARIGPRQVRRALRRIREQLPHGRPLAGLRFAAEGGHVVVGDGVAKWKPESGQGLLDFGVAELARKVAPMAKRAFREAKRDAERLTAEDWYAWGCELESAAPAEAQEAYLRALQLDSLHADAHVNLGRLLHDAGDPEAARDHYLRALEARPEDSTAAFNLGVALEDLGRLAAALAAYERAVSADPANTDAHFNAANLADRMGQPADALRHWSAYRKLSRETES